MAIRRKLREWLASVAVTAGLVVGIPATRTHAPGLNIQAPVKEVKIAPPFDSLGLHRIEQAILLVEYGPTSSKTNNFGNIRNRDLSYRKYDTPEEGLAAFRDLIRRKYSKCLALPTDEAVKCIASRYSEDPDEYARRLRMRLKQLKRCSP